MTEAKKDVPFSSFNGRTAPEETDDVTGGQATRAVPAGGRFQRTLSDLDPGGRPAWFDDMDEHGGAEENDR